MKTPILFLLGLTLTTLAHDGPETTIGHLTESILEAPNPGLFARRAAEYRQIGENHLAIADLQKAHILNLKNPVYLHDLAEIQLEDYQAEPALRTIDQALALRNTPDQQTAQLALKAKILLTLDRPKDAKSSIDQALAQNPFPPIHWYLTQSEINLALKDHNTRVADLENAHTQNPSVAITNAWIDAMLDAGQAKKALPIIEKELADSRLKAHWLYRHARAQLSLGNKQQAKTDLTASLAEIQTRLNPANPDILLQTLLNQAHTLLQKINTADSP